MHTNRELLLMLQGEKPLAAFCARPHESAEWAIPDDKFAPHIATGNLIRREYTAESVKPGEIPVRWVLYSVSAEEWRINAFIQMLETAAQTGWSERLERMQGSLLGYTDQQNDAFISLMFKESQS